jgi:uncharacterized repeat protein (TIGR03803 family)
VEFFELFVSDKPKTLQRLDIDNNNMKTKLRLGVCMASLLTAFQLQAEITMKPFATIETPNASQKLEWTNIVALGSGRPDGGLVQDTDGTFFGTTESGGANLAGTLYSISPSGTYSLLHSFGISDGYNPWGTPTIVGDTIYGNTTIGGTGAAGSGTIWKSAKDGSGFQVVYYFYGSNGISPFGKLLSVSNLIYGTCYGGGNTNRGTIFCITTNGTRQWVTSFTTSDGKYPRAGLSLVNVNGTNYLFGTTANGGSNDLGAVFRIGLDGNGLTILHHFTNNTQGMVPMEGLTLGQDGWFYSTTEGSNSYTRGTFFKIHPQDSSFVTITNFTESTAVRPQGMTKGRDCMYATTYYGGTSRTGAVYRVGYDASVTLAYEFTGASDNSAQPNTLVLGQDGAFYTVCRHLGSPPEQVGRLDIPQNPYVESIAFRCTNTIVSVATSVGQVITLQYKTNVLDSWIDVGTTTATNGYAAFTLPANSARYRSFYHVAVSVDGILSTYADALKHGYKFPETVSLSQLDDSCKPVLNPCTNCPPSDPPSFP